MELSWLDGCQGGMHGTEKPFYVFPEMRLRGPISTFMYL